jgi:hypothetical protein
MRQPHVFVSETSRKLKKLYKTYLKQQEYNKKFSSPKLDWNKGGEIIFKFAVLGSAVLLGISFFTWGAVILFFSND